MHGSCTFLSENLGGLRAADGNEERRVDRLIEFGNFPEDHRRDTAFLGRFCRELDESVQIAGSRLCGDIDDEWLNPFKNFFRGEPFQVVSDSQSCRLAPLENAVLVRINAVDGGILPSADFKPPTEGLFSRPYDVVFESQFGKLFSRKDLKKGLTLNARNVAPFLSRMKLSAHLSPSAYRKALSVANT